MSCGPKVRRVPRVDLPNLGGQLGQLYVKHVGREDFVSIWQPYALDRNRLDGDAIYLQLPIEDGYKYVRLDVVLDSLAHFIVNIEATGGVQRQRDGAGLVTDPEWLDLADTYADTCARIGRAKMVNGTRRKAKRKYASTTLI